MNYPFLFSSRERKGLYVLLVVSLVFIGVRLYFFPPQAFHLEGEVVLENKKQIHSSYTKREKIEYKKHTPYIFRKKSADTTFYPKHYIPSTKEKVNIELNSATQEDLIKLNGIGEKFALRIVKYRDFLGGFVAKEQLLQVYGMDSLLYRKIEKNITVNNKDVLRFNINKNTIDELAKCKRIGIKRARVVVSYREQHGDYIYVKDLLKTKVFSDSLLYLIEPYIILHD